MIPWYVQTVRALPHLATKTKSELQELFSELLRAVAREQESPDTDSEEK